jgi:hypothetical protein
VRPSVVLLRGPCPEIHYEPYWGNVVASQQPITARNSVAILTETGSEGCSTGTAV